jgi:hypothetical protein
MSAAKSLLLGVVLVLILRRSAAPDWPSVMIDEVPASRADGGDMLESISGVLRA